MKFRKKFYIIDTNFLEFVTVKFNLNLAFLQLFISFYQLISLVGREFANWDIPKG